MSPPVSGQSIVLKHGMMLIKITDDFPAGNDFSYWFEDWSRIPPGSSLRVERIELPEKKWPSIVVYLNYAAKRPAAIVLPFTFFTTDHFRVEV